MQGWILTISGKVLLMYLKWPMDHQLIITFTASDTFYLLIKEAEIAVLIVNVADPWLRKDWNRHIFTDFIIFMCSFVVLQSESWLNYFWALSVWFYEALILVCYLSFPMPSQVSLNKTYVSLTVDMNVCDIQWAHIPPFCVFNYSTQMWVNFLPHQGR